MNARLGPLVLALVVSGCVLRDDTREPDVASGQALGPAVPQGDDGLATPKEKTSGASGAGAGGKGASGGAGASPGTAGAGAGGKASGGAGAAGMGSTPVGAAGTAGSGSADAAGASGKAGSGSAGAAGGAGASGGAGLAGLGGAGGAGSSPTGPSSGAAGAPVGGAGAAAAAGGKAAAPSGGAPGTEAAGSAGGAGQPPAKPPGIGSWSTTAPLAVARYGHEAVRLLDGRVIVIGGGHCQESLASVEVWDPSLNSWMAAPSLITPRRGHRAMRMAGGQVIVVGGEHCWLVNQQYQCEYLASTEVWWPGSGAWVPGPDLWQARSEHQMLAVDGRLVVVGGYRWMGEELLTTWIERLDPGAPSWTTAGQMAGRLGHQLLARPDGKVLVVGGVDATYAPTTTTFVLDPLAGTVSPGASLLQHRAWSRAVAVAGSPLVVGGTASCASGECLLSETLPGSAWQIAGYTSAPREDHSATLLGDGSLLVVGSNFAVAMGSAERYTPLVGWQSVNPPNLGRAGHTATLLGDGRVLVAGGYTATACEVTTSSELFTP